MASSSMDASGKDTGKVDFTAFSTTNSSERNNPRPLEGYSGEYIKLAEPL
jgi:hypothetical protein